MQYLDINGVQLLWGKIKNLAAAGKSVVSIDTTAQGAFSGFTLTPITHNDQGEDGHVEYKLTLTDVQSASGLASILADYAEANDLESLEQVVSTLVGSDTNKSARTIAAEELAAQLIPQSAQEALDTLQEIAAWIQAHPADASAMNSRITALETVTALPQEGQAPASGTIAAYAKGLVDDEEDRATAEEERIEKLITATAAVDGVEGIDERLSAVETALGQTEGGTTIAEQVAAVQEAIDDLDWDAETSDNGQANATHVLTGIHVENGELLATGGIDEIEIAAIPSATLDTVLI